ncbi:MAG: TlpA family protein disulfide reductase [Gemmatimonadaceae bacterium]|nr:TlpA family protein disulfide reductase [Gemmatimonadaceae bacterium]
MFRLFRRTVMALAVVATPAFAQDVGIPLGEKGPGGPLEMLDGKPVDLTSYLGKGPVVLEFWATWCGNCKQMEPAMRTAMKAYGTKVQFITVAVSINQSLERVKAWQKINALPGVMLYDRKGEVSGAYDAPATSYMVVLDKTGKVIYTGVGGTQNVDAAVRKAM